MYRFALLIVAVVAQSAAAQDERPQEPGLSGKAAFGYLATSGNTESTNTNASFSVVYRREDWRHDFETSAVAASSAGESTAEAYQLDYEARRAYGENHYLFTAFDYKRDRFSGLAEQMSETVGYGRRLIELEAHELDGGLGAGARQSLRRDGTEEDDAILRGTLDYLWTMNDTAELEQALVGESGRAGTMLEWRTALRARIVGDVALVLSFRYKRNSEVPEGAASADRFTSVSLEYAF